MKHQVHCPGSARFSAPAISLVEMAGGRFLIRHASQRTPAASLDEQRRATMARRAVHDQAASIPWGSSTNFFATP